MPYLAAAASISALYGPGPPLPPAACAAPAPWVRPRPGPAALACVSCCWKFEFATDSGDCACASIAWISLTRATAAAAFTARPPGAGA